MNGHVHVYVRGLSVTCPWDIPVASRSRRVGGSPSRTLRGQYTDNTLTSH